jgi:hypothetical protein
MPSFRVIFLLTSEFTAPSAGQLTSKLGRRRITTSSAAERPSSAYSAAPYI